MLTIIPDEPDDDRSLKEAREWLQDNMYERAVQCPCCDRRTRGYHRKFNAGMAASLILIYRIGKGAWVSTAQMPWICREEDKIAYWGLLEVMPRADRKNRPDGGRGQGVWRITDLGVQFVKGQITIGSHAWTFDRKLVAMDDREMISIQDALGEEFNYQELMSA